MSSSVQTDLLRPPSSIGPTTASRPRHWRGGRPARESRPREREADVGGCSLDRELHRRTGVRIVDVRRLALDVELKEMIDDDAVRADITGKELIHERAGNHA